MSNVPSVNLDFFDPTCDPRGALFSSKVVEYLTVLKKNTVESVLSVRAWDAVREERGRYERFMQDKQFQIDQDVELVVDCLEEAGQVGLYSGLRPLYNLMASGQRAPHIGSMVLLGLHHYHQRKIEAIEKERDLASSQIDEASLSVFGNAECGQRMVDELSNRFIADGVCLSTCAVLDIKGHFAKAVTQDFQDKVLAQYIFFTSLPAGEAFASDLRVMAEGTSLLWKAEVALDDAEGIYQDRNRVYQEVSSQFNMPSYITRLVTNHFLIEEFADWVREQEMFKKFHDTVSQLAFPQTQRLG